MAILNLINQQAATTQIQPYINTLKNRLDNRKAVWDKLSVEKRRQWILSDKDPIMTLAYSIYKYLHKNFFSSSYQEND
jgi:conjugal transfer/entry exclusion protein